MGKIDPADPAFPKSESPLAAQPRPSFWGADSIHERVLLKAISVRPCHQHLTVSKLPPGHFGFHMISWCITSGTLSIVVASYVPHNLHIINFDLLTPRPASACRFVQMHVHLHCESSCSSRQSSSLEAFLRCSVDNCPTAQIQTLQSRHGHSNRHCNDLHWSLSRQSKPTSKHINEIPNKY